MTFPPRKSKTFLKRLLIPKLKNNAINDNTCIFKFNYAHAANKIYLYLKYFNKHNRKLVLSVVSRTFKSPQTFFSLQCK